MGKTATDEIKDTRVINSALRMPGFRDELTGLFQPGEVVDSVSRMQQLIDERELDVAQLKKSGVVSGDWKP